MMLSIAGRNLAYAAIRLAVISLGIFLILGAGANHDNKLDPKELSSAIISGRLVPDGTATAIPPLGSAFIYSATILVLAMVISYGIGVPLGILLGRYRMGWTRVAGHVVVSVALAIPAFWVAYVVLYQSVTEWRVLIIGETDRTREHWMEAYIGRCLLLAIPMSLSGLAIVTRQVFHTLIMAFPEESVKSARAAGISQRMMFDTVAIAVIWRPLLRSFPFLLSLFLSFLIVVETAFFVPGFGFALYKAAEQARTDLQSLAVLAMYVTAILVAANLIVDILVEWIDANRPPSPDME